MDTANSRRVAKNTILLYIRMLVTMFISLFTSRYILKALGVEDLGTYNVIGGIVGIISFLNSSMSSASTRFISVALANGDITERQKVFNTTFTLHFIIDIIVLFLLETIGLYFLNNYIVIPDGRYFAANVVYQFSCISCFMGILSVPFSAALVSHEKMGIYAYFAIFDVVFKLIITIILIFYSGDKLIFYSILLFISFIINYFINLWYCKKHFVDCGNIRLKLDSKSANSISKYIGWSMYTNTAHTSYLQGLSILLNLFFGPAVNASRGFAGSIQGMVMNFVGNFQMAINPQIIKTYAVGGMEQVMKLVYQSERITFYLMSIMMVPIILTTDTLLYIWLGQVPIYSDSFCRLILIMNFVNALSNPFMKIIQADGKLKKNSIYTGTALFLILPLSYFALKLGFDAPAIYVINLLIYILCYFIRLKIVYDLKPYNIKEYFHVCLLKPTKVIAIPTLLSVFVSNFIEHTIINVIIFDIFIVIIMLIFIFTFGLYSNERQFVANQLNKIRKKPTI